MLISWALFMHYNDLAKEGAGSLKGSLLEKVAELERTSFFGGSILSF